MGCGGVCLVCSILDFVDGRTLVVCREIMPRFVVAGVILKGKVCRLTGED